MFQIGILREKRGVVRALAEQVNDLKLRIESIKDDLVKMENDPTQLDDLNDLRADGTKLIDETQYKTLLLLKETKANYKQVFENWRAARSEMDYCERMVGQCRERFLAEFEQWFEDTYGAYVVTNDTTSSNQGIPAANRGPTEVRALMLY